MSPQVSRQHRDGGTGPKAPARGLPGNQSPTRQRVCTRRSGPPTPEPATCRLTVRASWQHLKPIDELSPAGGPAPKSWGPNGEDLRTTIGALPKTFGTAECRNFLVNSTSVANGNLGPRGRMMLAARHSCRVQGAGRRPGLGFHIAERCAAVPDQHGNLLTVISCPTLVA